MAAALQSSAPRIVGRYVLYGEIASGGMATVHFGRLIGPAGFSRPVAIKKLHAQFARDPDFVKMFLDEARLAARIAHPNVVPTLDVVAEQEEVFLVMEYVRGAALGQLVRTIRRRGERVQPLVGVGIVSGALQGLHAAHEARNDRGERLDLVHRDVSPQNVLVGADGIARILDFGVAKASGRLQTTRDGQLKGKLAYMAPEQVRGDPLTRRTDIYAASVVLWEVLTGKRLFYAENEASVLARVLSSDVPPPSSIVSDLPRTFDRVVLRGLQRDPERRYATAREMAADLDACIGVASPTEIGEWVELTAAEELRERSNLIAEVERAASELPELHSQQLVTGPQPIMPESLTSTGKRMRDGSSAWGLTTKKEKLSQVLGPDADEISQVSNLSQAHAQPATTSRPSRRLVSTIAVSAGIVALLLALVGFLQTRGATMARAAPAKPAATATPTADEPDMKPVSIDDLPSGGSPSAAPSAASSAPGPASRSSWKGVAPAPNLTPPHAANAPNAAASKAGVPPHAAPSAAAPAASSATPPPSDEADCNPPYTADAKGHIHFKPNCI